MLAAALRALAAAALEAVVLAAAALAAAELAAAALATAPRASAARGIRPARHPPPLLTAPLPPRARGERRGSGCAANTTSKG